MLTQDGIARLVSLESSVFLWRFRDAVLVNVREETAHLLARRGGHHLGNLGRDIGMCEGYIFSMTQTKAV